MKVRLLSILLASCCIMASCEKKVEISEIMKTRHTLEGGWLARDGTVFLFRSNGTFHGFDCHHREIWGNWVALSDQRIGFQSLMHTAYYNPQYAIINPSSDEQMDYIVSNGNHFISADRIPAADAEAKIKTVVEKSVHHP